MVGEMDRCLSVKTIVISVLGGSPGSKQKGPLGDQPGAGTNTSLAPPPPDWRSGFHLVPVPEGQLEQVHSSPRATRQCTGGDQQQLQGGPRDLRPIPGETEKAAVWERGGEGLASQLFWTKGGRVTSAMQKGKISPGPQAAWIREAARSTTSRLSRVMMVEEPELCLRFPRPQQLITPCINAASFTSRKAILRYTAHSRHSGKMPAHLCCSLFSWPQSLDMWPRLCDPTELCRPLNLGSLAAHIWVLWP